MENLNNMQKNYLKRLIDLTADYNDFESLGVESQIALLIMNESAISVEKLKKRVNSFMSMYAMQQQWNAKKLQSVK